MNRIKKIDLSNLSEQQMCQLARDIILHLENQTDTKIYSDTKNTRDIGYDLYGEYYLQDDIRRLFAVIVKQAKKVAPSYLVDVLRRISRLSQRPDELLFFTTAIIDQKALRIMLEGVEGLIDYEIWDRERIEEYLLKNPDILKKYFSLAAYRKKVFSIQTALGVLGSLASIIGIALSLFSFVQKDKAELPTQISKVEAAISNLRSLESTLQQVREDMSKTQLASLRIKKEYEDAQRLQQITEEQYRTISNILTKRSFRARIIDWIYGIILGLSTSLLGNVIYGWHKKQRKLVNE